MKLTLADLEREVAAPAVVYGRVDMNITKKILQAAKDKLTPETWGQGSGLIKRKQTCAAMAINLQEESVNDFMHAMQVLAQVIRPGSSYSAAPGVVLDFNDTLGRTLAEVHAKFDEAIARCTEE